MQVPIRCDADSPGRDAPVGARGTKGTLARHSFIKSTGNPFSDP
jgi:hypothetical protein